MEFPLEIAHVEEIEEDIVEEEEDLSEQTQHVVHGQKKVVVIQNPQRNGRPIQIQQQNPGTTVRRVIASSGPAGVTVKPVTVAGAKSSAPITVTKTITMAQAKQMGLITPAGTSSMGNRVLTLNPTIKPKAAVAAPVKVMKPAVTTTPKLLNSAVPRTQAIEIKVEPQIPQKSEQRVVVSSQAADQLQRLEGSVVVPGFNQGKVVMLPPDYISQLRQANQEKHQKQLQQQQQQLHEDDADVNDIIVQAESPTPVDLIDLPAKKRPCNCTRSQCLKLYCECFANGEFCSDCNCKDCFNTMEKEDERQQAIYSCLERNPNAFRPKIGKANSSTPGLRHHKGCHCKRSGCLKNYCECFEAKIPCSEMCKCVDCKNCSEDADVLKLTHTTKVSAIKRAVAAATTEGGSAQPKPMEDDEPPPKQPYNFMTPDVVDATVQCMMAQADECQQNGVSARNTERLILEEFGRCLAEIIDFSSKNPEMID